jgi:hypothetical protein
MRARLVPLSSSLSPLTHDGKTESARLSIPPCSERPRASGESERRNRSDRGSEFVLGDPSAPLGAGKFAASSSVNAHRTRVVVISVT